MKFFLKRYICIEDAIKPIVQEIKDLRNSQQLLREGKSVVITGMPKGNATSDTVGEHVCKIIDIYEKRIVVELLPEIENVRKRHDEIFELLKCLNSVEYCVIKLIYIDKVSWINAAIAMNYSDRQCKNIHADAIKKLIRECEKRFPEISHNFLFDMVV